MGVYEYIAKDSTGSRFTGEYKDVETIADLKDELSKMGYTLVKAHKKKTGGGGRGKIRQSEIISFVYEFSGMFTAGLSVIRSLETFESQVENERLKHIITDVRQRVETGATLKDAFEPYRHVFSSFFIGMIEAGESGGKLGETLQMAAEYMESQDAIRSKVKSAFTYPIVVGVMCTIIVTALVIFVIPVFQKLYSQLNVPLPMATLILIGLSKAVRQYWFIVTPAVVITIVGIKLLFKNKAFLAHWDEFVLNVPMFGKLNRYVQVGKFTRTFAMMTSAGVPLVDSLSLATDVVDNSVMKKIGEDIREQVMTGSTLSEPMARHDIFPPIIVQLASAGEEAGVLPEMLTKGVDFMDNHIDRTVKAMIVKIEPIMSLLMGLIVGGILLGVYLPMFDYMSHYQ